ncbi:MAG: NYN domain-containing protein [Clostridia bacterium]|nr:NYN domain-containing protein [Clostridia bacterium]
MPANIAIFIDAENVDPSFANQIFGYARSLGLLTVREIYGSGISLNEWADAILENTIHCNFTLRPNRFKNSSDIALTIGAMCVLHASQNSEDKKVDAVIIASSDSDFSPLAFHLRAAGIDVIGMGEQGRINPMWPKACTEFVELTPGQPLVRKREVAASKPAPQSIQAAIPILPSEQKPAVPAIDETTSVEEAAPPPKPAEEMKGEAAKKTAAVKIARSHSARVQLIRSFITEQLANHAGRIKSGELFKALATLPDYKFDQQRSRRRPLDYLETQFAAWFVLEPGENGSFWISSRHATISDEQSATTDDQPAASSEQPALMVETEPPSAVYEQPIAAEKKEPAAATRPDDPRAALIEAGIPVQDVDRVTAILSNSKNLLSAYNGLSKAYGRKQGGQYYQLIKARFNGDAPVQLEMTEIAAEQPIQDDPEQTEEVKDAPREVQPEATLEQYLLDRGIEAAAQIAAIVAGTANLRIAYNELRKAFGAEKGRAYLSLIKEHRS